MSDFIVSARKYRPSDFNSVVGQISTTSTLKNAIKTSHLAQAYLFCGPRGVGKTTCARIFAKTINCTNLTQKGEACNECESCRTFSQNRSFNIHELDAASNNSVDDIRNLIDQVRIPPQVGRFSVYIIDEVHMLSQSAFNAFLKTLEEPPRHAIFILATTEKHKILPTILSRCQIFDFNRIKINDIVDYLVYIADKENIKYEKDALSLIAHKADGGMRDALSVFDQIASFSENHISYQNVIDNLNILDYEYYFRLVDYFLVGDVASAIVLFDEVLTKGFDAQNFINGLSMHFRDIMICKAEKTLQLLEVGENIKEKYKEQASRCTDPFIFNSLNICNETDLSYKQSKNPRLHIELALIRLCNQSGEKKKDDQLADKLYLPDNKLPVINTDKTTGVNTPLPQKVEKAPMPVEISATDNRKSEKSMPSIKDALRGISTPNNISEEENELNNLVSIANDEIFREFTLNELIQKWNDYTETIKETDHRIYLALKNQVPELKDNYLISIEFRNNTIIDNFKTGIKASMLSFLRTQLENSGIEFEERIIDDDAQTPIKHYSDLEKLKYMAEKNPALQKLRQEFNLDIE